MAEFLDNNDNIIKEELMTYYHFRANLLKHINDRIDVLDPSNGTEYDYCTTQGQLKELKSLLEYVKTQGRNTLVSKLTESTNKTN